MVNESFTVFETRKKSRNYQLFILRHYESNVITLGIKNMKVYIGHMGYDIIIMIQNINIGYIIILLYMI